MIEYIDPNDQYDIEVLNRNFAELAQKIDNLPAMPAAPITPKQVYAATRPADWLPMPTPEDDEAYMLIHIPAGLSVSFAYTVVCQNSGDDFEIAAGVVENGVYKPLTSEIKRSGATVRLTLAADDFGNMTGEGMAQCMIRISGADITRIYPQPDAYWGFYEQNIVEIACRLPFCSEFANTGKYSKSTNKRPYQMLRYFAWYGENQLTDASSMFDKCGALRAVLALDMSKVVTAKRMYYGCYALKAITPTPVPRLEDMTEMFCACPALEQLPLGDMPSVRILDGACRDCISLAGISDFYAPKAESAKSLFSGCNGLCAVAGLDLPLVKDISNIFYGCYNLVSVSGLNAPSAQNAYRAFYQCRALLDIDGLDKPALTNAAQVFGLCCSLRVNPKINTTRADNMAAIFNNCDSLVAITDLDVTSAQGEISFSYCYNLRRVTVRAVGGKCAGVDLVFTDGANRLDRAALVELFNSLPVITGGNTIKLRGNGSATTPGAASLTAADKAIATEKGWQVQV